MDTDMEKDTETPDLLLLPAPVAALPVPVSRMPTVPQLAVALGGLALVFALSYFPIQAKKEGAKAEATAPSPRADEPAAEADAFKDIDITARAAYVWDIKNQKALYNKNAGKQLPLASLTKLMTALIAYEHLDAENRVAITTEALLEEGDSMFSGGEIFTMHDLANFTLITSSNDGAYALAAATGAALASSQNPTDAFINTMNAKAEELGLSQSYFTNPTGLDVDGTQSGSYGSARDMAFLMEYLALAHPEILEGTKAVHSTIYSQEGAALQAVNTNERIADIPGLIGSKTGFTRLAGGNLVIAYDAGLNRPIVIAVLGSTREGRFSDVTTLIDATSRALTNR